MTDFIVDSDADLSADPLDRVWTCPNCEAGYLIATQLITPVWIGKALMCTEECGYWEAVR